MKMNEMQRATLKVMLAQHRAHKRIGDQLIQAAIHPPDGFDFGWVSKHDEKTEQIEDNIWEFCQGAYTLVKTNTEPVADNRETISCVERGNYDFCHDCAWNVEGNQNLPPQLGVVTPALGVTICYDWRAK